MLPARDQVGDARRAGVTVVAAMLVFTACTGGGDAVAPTTSLGNATTTTMPARSNDGILDIGIYLPRTGPGAPLGEPMIATVEAAIEEINLAGGVLGRPVQHSVLDEGAGIGPDELLDQRCRRDRRPGVIADVALSQLGSIVRAFERRRRRAHPRPPRCSSTTIPTTSSSSGPRRATRCRWRRSRVRHV